MAKVVYNGSTDLRIFDASDLKRAGVEGFKKTVFRKGEPTEVSQDVADALVNHIIFDDFDFVSDDTELDLVEDEEPKAKPGRPTRSGSQSTGARTAGDSGSTSGSTSGAMTAAGDGGSTGGSSAG